MIMFAGIYCKRVAINIRLNFLAKINPYSVPLLIPAPISENFPDREMINDFHQSLCIELNSTSAIPRFFGATKRYLGGNDNTSLTQKHNCFLRVGD